MIFGLCHISWCWLGIKVSCIWEYFTDNFYLSCICHLFLLICIPSCRVLYCSSHCAKSTKLIEVLSLTVCFLRIRWHQDIVMSHLLCTWVLNVEVEYKNVFFCLYIDMLLDKTRGCLCKLVWVRFNVPIDHYRPLLANLVTGTKHPKLIIITTKNNCARKWLYTQGSWGAVWCECNCSKLRQGDKFTSSVYSGTTAELPPKAGPPRLWVCTNYHSFHFAMLQYLFTVFSTWQRYILSPAHLLIRPSYGWISQKQLKIGLLIDS